MLPVPSDGSCLLILSYLLQLYHWSTFLLGIDHSNAPRFYALSELRLIFPNHPGFILATAPLKLLSIPSFSCTRCIALRTIRTISLRAPEARPPTALAVLSVPMPTLTRTGQRSQILLNVDGYRIASLRGTTVSSFLTNSWALKMCSDNLRMQQARN